MTVTEEHPFCEARRHLIFFSLPTLIRTLKALPHLSLDNLSNIKTIAKECVLGKSNSWLVYADFQKKPVSMTVPLVKSKPSGQTVRLMTEYYEASASDDLALANEFEGFESEIDKENSQ